MNSKKRGEKPRTKIKKIKKFLKKTIDKLAKVWYNKYRKREREVNKMYTLYDFNGKEIYKHFCKTMVQAVAKERLVKQRILGDYITYQRAR